MEVQYFPRCTAPGITFKFKFKFCPLCPVCHLRVHTTTCALLPLHLPLTRLLYTSLTSLYLLLFLLLPSSPFSSLCYYGVCLSLPLCLKGGVTALMKASINGCTATVELLLGAGADKEAKDQVRET